MDALSPVPPAPFTFTTNAPSESWRSQVTREMGLEIIKTEWERTDWLLEARALLKTRVVT